MLIRHEIARLVGEAVTRAQERGDLPPMALPEVTVEHPAREEHGDYAASLPMKLARAVKSEPLAIAEVIVAISVGIVVQVADIERPQLIFISIASCPEAHQFISIIS